MSNNRILVVDDAPAIHEDFRRILGAELESNPVLHEAYTRLFGPKPRGTRTEAFQIDCATSGEEALDLMREAATADLPFLMAFIDVRMPRGWDGVETARRIWQLCPELPVVLCTAHSDYTWEGLVQTLGHDSNFLVLRKPFEREEVLQMAHFLARTSRSVLGQDLPGRSGPAPPFKLLILDDDPLTLDLLGSQFRRRMPAVTTLQAKSVAEAQTLLNLGRIDFFLLDIVVPDGSGIDFLSNVQVTQPEALVVLMTAQALPHYRTAAEELGVLRFMEKPIDISELVDLVEGRRRALEGPSRSASNFAARLTQLTVVDIVQLKCVAGVDSTLEVVRHDGAKGRIEIRRGEIVHAERGAIVGEEAFTEILSWKQGRVEELPYRPEVRQTINVSWQGLLLSAVQCLDERSSQP